MCGIPLDPLTVSQIHDVILEACESRHRLLALNLNAHAVNLAHDDQDFLKCFREAGLVFCDGEGVRVAAQLAGDHIPERITYADWFWQFAAFCAEKEISLFLLGGEPGRADEATNALRERSPRLRVVGTHHGFFDKSSGSAENASVVERINHSGADVLLVCFGMPLQEKWLRASWDALECRVGLCGGAALDYIAGAVKRPPRFLRAIRSEWLGRLLIEPRRLWRRYLLGNPRFIMLATRYAVASRLGRSRRSAGSDQSQHFK